MKERFRETGQKAKKWIRMLISAALCCLYAALIVVCFQKGYEDYLLNESVAEVLKIFLFATGFLFLLGITFPPEIFLCGKRPVILTLGLACLACLAYAAEVLCSAGMGWLTGTFLICCMAAALLLWPFHRLYRKWMNAPERGRFGERQKKGIVQGGSFICGIGLVCLFASSRFGRAIEPLRDEEGYYLLRNRAGFEWMIDAVNGDEEGDINVRLVKDIVLNDTDGYEDWKEHPPENRYYLMLYYNGIFDGNGHALIGYFSGREFAIFGRLRKQAVVKDLEVRESFFYTTYDTWYYTNDDGMADIMEAASICITNDGQIENCTVDACVVGAGEAGGIVSGNYGSIRNCRFLGTVTAGTCWKDDEITGEEYWENTSWCAGGICRYNEGEITSCVNEGAVVNYGMEGEGCCERSSAGGIAGRNARGGSITYSENSGSVQALHWAGGITFLNGGEIYHCGNSGTVLVEPVDTGYVQNMASGGICSSNGGIIDSCYNTGEATVRQTVGSFQTPVYAIADSNINPDDGEIRNCYYLDQSTDQLYRQSGVYRLSEEEMTHIEDYLTGDLGMEDTDTLALLSDDQGIPGTGEADFTRLVLEPDAEAAAAGKDGEAVYEVQPGNSLWGIAEKCYGDGSCYPYLVREPEREEDALICPGDLVRAPEVVFYLLHASDDEGTGYAYRDPESTKPGRYLFVKPRDWYIGSTDCDRGISAMWPKTDEEGVPTHDHDSGIDYAGTRILYCADANGEGDVFADWAKSRQSIRESAAAYGGDAVQNLCFYRYRLDNGNYLYGYSFRLVRQEETLNCAAFYRLQEGMRAEYIGIEPYTGSSDLLERVRYLAARVDQGEELVIPEESYTGEEYGGRENWAFPLLHNPFWIAGNYDLEEENGVYALFTGQ